MTTAAAVKCDLPTGMTGQRQFARARLELAARLVTFNGTGPCTVIDVSCTGAKIGAAESPRIGSMVVVEDAPIELFGTVQWIGLRCFGIHFDSPLPLETVVALRHHADATPERTRRAQLSYASDWVDGRV